MLDGYAKPAGGCQQPDGDSESELSYDEVSLIIWPRTRHGHAIRRIEGCAPSWPAYRFMPGRCLAIVPLVPGLKKITALWSRESDREGASGAEGDCDAVGAVV